MHTALLRTEEMSPVAVRSYYVDFYLTQALEGGFAQYAFMSADRAETDTLVRDGMAGMGATAHLDLFNRAAEAYDHLSGEEEEFYLDGGLDAEETPDGVLRMEELDNEFEELLERENITALNAAWLRNQADLLVLDDRSEEHTSELQSRQYLVCRLLLEKKKKLSITYLCITRATQRPLTQPARHRITIPRSRPTCSPSDPNCFTPHTMLPHLQPSLRSVT